MNWLLDSDVSIQFQVYRDLLGENRPDLQARIATEGWGKAFLDARGAHGHWGMGYYQPKWISSHYTLLDLRNLCLPRGVAAVDETIQLILNEEKSADGGINPGKTIAEADVCVNGMMLNVFCWFGVDEKQLESVIDFILSQVLPDGGYNCRLNRSGARHSSLHSTISVLEGLTEFRLQGYQYRLTDVILAEQEAQEFLLMHHLYKSDKTGEIIHPRFLRLPYPPRWYYDTLRALDYFVHAGTPYDPRMQDALDELISRRTKNGRWKVQGPYAGQVHFTMEKAGTESWWNTLRARRVFKGLRLNT